MRHARALSILIAGLLTACGPDHGSVSSPPSATPQLQSDGLVDTEASPAQPGSEPSAEAAAPMLVDHVGLTVKDLEATKGLFVSVLGFAVRSHDPEYPAYVMSNGVATITLWRASDPGSAVAFDRKRNVGLHHLALRVSSFEALDALHEALAAHPGVVIEFAPELAYGGPAKHMMFREPSGNRIELVHRPS